MKRLRIDATGVRSSAMGKSNGLRALELAQLIVCDVMKAIDQFPRKDPLGLAPQIAKSANSTSACIAEGVGRATPAERLNKLRLARGELEETQHHLKIAGQCGYFDRKTFYRIWNRTACLHRMIARLMRREQRAA